jgi:hypothetical protein
VRAASIIRVMMMEAASTSETSIDIQLRTRQYISEDSELQNETRFNENAREKKAKVRKIFIFPLLFKRRISVDLCVGFYIIPVFNNTFLCIYFFRLSS